MSKQDFYDVLGVSKEVDSNSLKSAYRRLAMKYHPDKNPGDSEAEKIQKISEAYDFIVQRKKPRMINMGMTLSVLAAVSGVSEGFGSGLGVFQIFLKTFLVMQQAKNNERLKRGEDLKYEMSITLRDAYLGVKKLLRYFGILYILLRNAQKIRMVLVPVDHVRGSGRIKTSQGFFTVERTCPACGEV